MRGENKCGHCGKFFKWEEADSYTPFGCSSYNPPTPHDPIFICGNCSSKLKRKWIERFKNNRYNGVGDWCKSRAEIEAAKECGFIWIGNDSKLERNGRRFFNEYVSIKYRRNNE